MLFSKYLLLSFLVVRVQLFLHQLQQFLFVNINDTAKIQCSSKKKFVAGRITAQWYKRREDSYTTSSWVLLLAPSPHGLLSPGTTDLACMFHGVSNLVHISWSISGDLQKHGLMRSLKAKDGSFVFINHISVPMDTWTSGKNFTCEVKFNSSGKSVRKIARYMEVHPSGCMLQMVRYAVVVFLVVVVVSVSLAWSHCCSNPDKVKPFMPNWSLIQRITTRAWRSDQ
ncbi:uncharacterized protein LOC119848045 isoform X2 [Dermochelys coriacea]|uniref:uncharacterized protein LOC119848045 isoform X2 n=1 Tax=Dermochelys coriacea TaxID=27794 RepID=UPI001CAA038D|nr:uncharacterized protein LOC119848045 isoform X2 [Dermochelys coriacea]